MPEHKEQSSDERVASPERDLLQRGQDWNERNRHQETAQELTWDLPCHRLFPQSGCRHCSQERRVEWCGAFPEWFVKQLVRHCPDDEIRASVAQDKDTSQS